MAELLSAEELAGRLSEVEGWQGDTQAIMRTVTLPSFLEGLRLVMRVGEAAEEMDHHPDIDIRWRTLTFTLSTHSAGGVTGLDLMLARRINDLL